MTLTTNTSRSLLEGIRIKEATLGQDPVLALDHVADHVPALDHGPGPGHILVALTRGPGPGRTQDQEVVLKLGQDQEVTIEVGGKGVPGPDLNLKEEADLREAIKEVDHAPRTIQAGN